jgi:hypothetical protein
MIRWTRSSPGSLPGSVGSRYPNGHHRFHFAPASLSKIRSSTASDSLTSNGRRPGHLSRSVIQHLGTSDESTRRAHVPPFSDPCSTRSGHSLSVFDVFVVPSSRRNGPKWTFFFEASWAFASSNPVTWTYRASPRVSLRFNSCDTRSRVATSILADRYGLVQPRVFNHRGVDFTSQHVDLFVNRYAYRTVIVLNPGAELHCQEYRGVSLPAAGPLNHNGKMKIRKQRKET